MSSKSRFLEGRTAWVTGGVTGIGRSIAECLAAAGASVAIGSPPAGTTFGGTSYAMLPDSMVAEDARRAIEAHGVGCVLEPLELRDDASVDAFHAKVVKELGPVDILVNAAGVCAQQPMLEADEETWGTVLDINLTGAYRTSRRCMGPMQERKWGRFIHVGSTAASSGFAGYGAYCASKHGLLGLSRCAAMEGAEHGITSNVISPGSADTGMLRLGSERRVQRGGPGRTAEENVRSIAEGMPQGRLIEGADIANVAVFLCRDEARGLTAEDILVTGGAIW